MATQECQPDQYRVCSLLSDVPGIHTERSRYVLRVNKVAGSACAEQEPSMIHRIKYVIFILAALLLPSSPMASAGVSVPTWIEGIHLSYYLDINGQQEVSASGSPIRGVQFGVDNFHDGRSPGSGFTDEALVDYQNVAGPLVLYVDSAAWNSGSLLLSPVTLDVYSYSPSAHPPKSMHHPWGRILKGSISRRAIINRIPMP